MPCMCTSLSDWLVLLYESVQSSSVDKHKMKCNFLLVPSSFLYISTLISLPPTSPHPIHLLITSLLWYLLYPLFPSSGSCLEILRGESPALGETGSDSVSPMSSRTSKNRMSMKLRRSSGSANKNWAFPITWLSPHTQYFPVPHWKLFPACANTSEF